MSHIPYIERELIYADALAKWGLANQLFVAIEEMSEVAKALTKIMRYNKPLSLDKKSIEGIDSLIEEIADASITLEQLKFFFNIGREVDNAMDAKIERLNKKIKSGEE